VLVIGGIFVFEGCSRAKTPASQLADNESQPGTLTPAPTPVSPVDETNLTAVAQQTPLVAPAPVAPVAPVVPSKTYVAKKGDSLYKIAKAEKITVEQLAKANNLTKASLLKIDQKLTIPAAMAKATSTPVISAKETMLSPSAPALAGNAYEVKKGDSLWKIAKSNNTTITALKQANNMTKDALQVGQKLAIPVKTMVTPSATPVVPASASTAATAPASSGPAVIAPSLIAN
jgi:LysM repeat protein